MPGDDGVSGINLKLLQLGEMLVISCNDIPKQIQKFLKQGEVLSVFCQEMMAACQIPKQTLTFLKQGEVLSIF